MMVSAAGTGHAFFGLARAYHDFDNDPSLRAAVFFGHGENFSRGIDVDAFAPLARTGQPFAVTDGMLDPFARTQKLSKPLIAGGLFRTEDFIEGRKAEAEGRPPVYQGK
jgi:enoyl-CoA hydratase/carnithine racemase